MTPFDPRLPVIAAAARVKPCHVFHCFHAWRQMGAHFHASQFAQFTGLEERHISAILSALESHGAVPRSRTASPKGTRLPADFRMPQEWIDWASNERHWPVEEVQAEADIFRDFWHAKPGSDACKLDWKATWRNWVRNSRRPDGDYYPSRASNISPEEELERRAALYERIGRTNEAKEIRDRLASSANVIPFNTTASKVA